MPTRNINLTPEQDAFISEMIEAGEYQNASEAIRDAVRALKQRRHEDALKLKGLRTQVRAGIEALKRGDFLEIEEMELDRYLEDMRSASEDVG
jgi:antitoxin ParD1/3/4